MVAVAPLITAQRMTTKTRMTRTTGTTRTKRSGMMKTPMEMLKLMALGDIPNTGLLPQETDTLAFLMVDEDRRQGATAILDVL